MILEVSQRKLKTGPGLPWWLSDKKTKTKTKNTYQRRRCGFDPWSGKIPHTEGQLSPGATTTEPACPRTTGALQLENHPLSSQLERSLLSSKDPAQPKINK